MNAYDLLPNRDLLDGADARRDACDTIKQLLCQFREGGAHAPVRAVFVALAQPPRGAARRA